MALTLADRRRLDSVSVCSCGSLRPGPGRTSRSVPGRPRCTRGHAQCTRACAQAARGHRHALVSQRNRVDEHSITQRRVQACLGYDVHMPPQQLLGVHQQAPKGEGTGNGGQRHKQIDVAVRSRIVPSHRAEDANARDAAALCQLQKLFAVGLEQIVHETSVAVGAFPARSHRAQRGTRAPLGLRRHRGGPCGGRARLPACAGFGPHCALPAPHHG
jgi:hypothetical protein